LEGWRRWGKETLVEPEVPNGSFETLSRDMTGQLGVEPSSFGRLKKLGQGLGLVEPKVPNGSLETLNGHMTGKPLIET